MKIGLLTDAPKHNLALMKLSAWHKASGDEIIFNMPLWKTDISYASILFEQNKKKFLADTYGGPAFNGSRLGSKIEAMKPDYSLFNLNYSLGYTWEYCPRKCGFCKVPKQNNPKTHRSIWQFHDSKFNEICLLNNNTFSDAQWKETFEEIWDANLIVRDENGYDLRLLDDEKADALYKTKWSTPIHFAWDCIKDEIKIIRGLKLLGKHKLRTTSNGVYLLIGYDTTEAEDLHRCQVIDDYGLTPYPMPFIFNDYTKRFKRFINLHYYRKYKTIKEAWNNYKR